MKRAILILVCCGAASLAQTPGERDTSVPDGRGGRSGPSFGDPRFPTAGTILGTFPLPLTPASDVGIFSMEYDIVRNRMWMGAQPPAGGGPNIYGIDPGTFAVVATYTIVNPVCPGNIRAYTGQVNGITVTRNGRFVINDFNGDAATVDDCAAEIDPATSAVVNAWRLDSGTCPATCAASGNTNNPRVRLDSVRDSTNIDTATSDPGGAQTFIFCTSPAGVAGPDLHVVQLSPGCPGTWFRRSTFTPAGVLSPSGLDWDNQTQSLWVVDRTSAGTGNSIYEFKYNRSTNVASVVQSWPSPSADFSIAIGVQDDHDVANHEVWAAANQSLKIIRYDSGHAPAYVTSTPGGPGAVTVRFNGDPQDNGFVYVGVASFAPAAFGLPLGNNRELFVNPDALFTLTLSFPNLPPTYSGFQGTLTAAGQPTPVNPPVGTVSVNLGPVGTGLPLAFAFVALEGGAGGTAVNGISGYSAPFSVLLP